MSKVQWSERQKDLFRVYNTTNSNILVNAGPGSGKSFTMLEVARQTPTYKRSIFLAFNKSIAEENSKKLPNNIASSTLHSLGFKILFKLVTGARFMVNEIKTFIIIRKKLKLVESKFRNEKLKNKYLFSLSELYNLYRINLIDFNQEKGEFLSEMEDLSATYDFELQKNTLEDFYNLVLLMKEEDQKILNGQENMIDFTDMLWLLTYFPVSEFPKYDVVFLDECQDVNPLQKSLFDKIRKPNGRFVAVGDKRQLIYAFQGSNYQSFKELERTPNTVQLPLDISYRCSKNVISASNLIFPDLPMNAFESNIDGQVRVGKVEEIEKGDFVLCRNNKPLIEMFIELLKIGKSANIYGKDYGETLLKLMDEVTELSESEIALYFEEKLRLTKKMLEEKGIPNPSAHPQYTNLLEKVIILDILYKEFLSYKRVVDLIKELFKEDIDMSNTITLMTGHRSKGLETDRVFILNWSLLPSPYAISSNSLYSEKCLGYVMLTRAKKEVIFLEKSFELEQNMKKLAF